MKSKQKKPGAQPIRLLTIDELIRDPFINRPLDDKRAERMASAFKPDLFGVPEVSRRGDGKYAIVDGQHRIEALRILGWNGQRIACKIFDGLSRADEAERFLGLNDFRTPRKVEKFLVRLTAKDPIACAVNRIVGDAGYVVDRQSRDGVICATDSLESIYLGRGQKIRGQNPDALRQTLDVITLAWGRTKAAVNAQVLLGVGSFILRYADNIDLKRLVQKLIGVPGGSSGLTARGRGKKELHGGTLASGIAHYIVESYNRGLRGKSRLPSWRSED